MRLHGEGGPQGASPREVVWRLAGRDAAAVRRRAVRPSKRARARTGGAATRRRRAAAAACRPARRPTTRRAQRLRKARRSRARRHRPRGRRSRRRREVQHALYPVAMAAHAVFDELHGRLQGRREQDLLEVADLVAVVVHEVRAGVRARGRHRGNIVQRHGRELAAVQPAGRQRIDALAAFQMVELEQQRVGVRTVLEREVRAHREDLLRHQAQFVHDGAFGAPLDGAQGLGHGSHGRSFADEGGRRPANGPGARDAASAARRWEDGRRRRRYGAGVAGEDSAAGRRRVTRQRGCLRRVSTATPERTRERPKGRALARSQVARSSVVRFGATVRAASWNARGSDRKDGALCGGDAKAGPRERSSARHHVGHRSRASTVSRASASPGAKCSSKRRGWWRHGRVGLLPAPPRTDGNPQARGKASGPARSGCCG